MTILLFFQQNSLYEGCASGTNVVSKSNTGLGVDFGGRNIYSPCSQKGLQGGQKKATQVRGNIKSKCSLEREMEKKTNISGR